jgi:5-methylcytosine-specific restriction protein A
MTRPQKLTRPARPCSYPGCGALVFDGTSRCPAHSKVGQFRGMSKDRPRQTWADSPTGPSPYASAAWKRLRVAWLRAHPLCATCEKQGRLRAASEVDHVIPHCGSRLLFWDRSNLASICASCHSSKTSREVNARIAQRRRDKAQRDA